MEVWSLLLSWVPFVGDPLTLVAGILRENFWVFLLLVTIGKAARYFVVVAAV
jgi:membrane protein YqaA with SNARE-associated domain